jgi:hypothetical protein
MAPGWLDGCPGLHFLLNRRPLHRHCATCCSPSVDGGHLTDELFPRKGAVEPGGASGTRQIVDRKGPERVSHKGFLTFTGKSQA